MLRKYMHAVGWFVECRKGNFEADSDSKRKNDQVLRAERQCFYRPPTTFIRLYVARLLTLLSAYSSGKQRLVVETTSRNLPSIVNDYHLDISFR
jgi:hypothetical protein